MENKYRFLDSKNEHLHQLNIDGEWKPLIGTSSVVNVLAKNLTWWAAELSAVECLEAGEKIPTIRQEYLEAVKSPDKKKAIDALCKKYPLFRKARFAHFDKKNETAEAGTDLHGELEKFCKEGERAKIDWEDSRIKTFIDWTKKNVKRFIASEGHCYSERLWVGGITDLLLEDNEGKLAIMDFKSAKEAYKSHFIQCAGYALEIEENGVLDKNGNQMFDLKGRTIDYFAVFPFGAEKPKPKIDYDTESMKEGFRAALTLYKLTNGLN